MDPNISFRNLKPSDLNQMFEAFLDSFSDYKVPFRLNKDQFVRKFVEKLKIDFSLSVGAFDHRILVGFIFTAANYYEGKLTAYNGGTGVRPSYRGHRLTHRMYGFLLPLLAEKKISQCVLEVLTDNDRAIKAYQGIGFEKSKYFKCFKLISRKLQKPKPPCSLEVFSVSKANWQVYEPFFDQQPSFLDSQRMIDSNIANETIIEGHHEGQCIGYAIFQPDLGRISQIGVSHQHRRQGVGSAMINYIHSVSNQKALTIININQRLHHCTAFFEKLGFVNQLNQYEMILSLDQ